MKYIEIQVSGERILNHEQKGNMMGWAKYNEQGLKR
jgi:hypothetical protein